MFLLSWWLWRGPVVVVYSFVPLTQRRRKVVPVVLEVVVGNCHPASAHRIKLHTSNAFLLFFTVVEHHLLDHVAVYFVAQAHGTLKITTLASQTDK